MNKGKICISLCAKTASDLFEKVGRAEPLAEVIELRFDCLEPEEIDSAVRRSYGWTKRKPNNLLATYRPFEQGGNRVLTLEEREEFWFTGNDTAFWTGDFEEDLIEDSFYWLFGDRICSFHDFSERPPEVQPVFDRLAKTGAAHIKIAIGISSITDSIPLWNLLQRSANSIIPIAMGEAGKWTRILGLAHGAFMTYAALDEADATAPGQITAADMIDVYRVKDLSTNTKVHGIVAGNTSYSISPWMHNAGFKAAGEDRVFIPLQVADLDAFMKRMVRPETREVDLNFSGFSVTNPHKQAIMAYLDQIDGTAKMIGAVNTVKIEDGKLFGYNTDAAGFIDPLKNEYGDLNRAKVAVVGAGGAARACVYSLTKEGADVTVFARDTSKAAGLANSFDIEIETIPPNFHGFDIVVNCTPLGTKGDTEDKTIATAEQLAGVKLVYDLVYNPTETKLIHEAKQADAKTLGGLEMLIAQGAEQFRIWTGREAPLEAMAAAVKRKLNL